MNETAVTFDCDGDTLVGVVSAPAPAQPGDTGVVIIVGGPQYRVGSHRQFVQLAQTLAGGGFPTLRFDVRGMGDSDGAQRDYEAIDNDIGAAIGALQRAQPQLRRIVLWGLCGGASAALLYLRATRDPRVQGLVLVNPWVRSELTLARARVKHYYLQRVMQPEFWVKVLRGGVAVRALGEFLRSAQTSVAGAAKPARVGGRDADLPLAQRMADAWSAFGGASLLILSGNDYTAKEFLETVQMAPQWQAQLAQPQVTRLDIVDADHTFSQPEAQARVEAATATWLRRLDVRPKACVSGGAA